LSAGDKCLANYQQLTWVNESKPLVVNMYNSSNKQTISADLTASGRSAAEILKSSFGYNPSASTVFSNLNFAGTGSLNFTKFMLDNPADYTLLDNSLYVNRDISNVLYGFNGTEGHFVQLIPTSDSLPAGLLYVQQYSVAPIQQLSTITDVNNQAISAMSNVWDFTAAGDGVVVATGSVQPVLFKCPLKSVGSYKCDQSYTSPQLISQYRITRLLGGNSRYVYFMGLDLAAAAVKIFAIKL